MVDSKFFNIPFATSGDKATIPEAVQPGGAMSYTEGFGPDYERDPASDPLAKRVPRDETNEYLFQITNSLRFIQLYGLPEWYSVANGGPANYPLTARVRYDAGAGMQAWISLVAANTAIPGSDATKWALDEYFNLTALEATAAEAIAGTIGTKLITPRRLSAAAQRGGWNYVAATGTNALVLTLAPALAAYTTGQVVRFKTANDSTGAVTLNVNGLGAVPLLPAIFRLKAAKVYEAVYDGTNFNLMGVQGGDVVLSSLSRITYTGAPVAPDDTITTAPISSFSDDGQADFTRSGNVLTCARAGRYEVLANFGCSLAVGTYVSALTIGIRKNGTEFFSSSLRFGSTIINQMFSGASDVADFVVGDTIDGWVYQQSGAAKTIPMASRVSFLRLTS